MSVRDEILKIFESGKGEYYSGQQLASMLGVSRNAVWKAVRQLEADGYRFSAVSGKGYAMSRSSDVLSKSGIEKLLGQLADRLDIHVYKSVTSTNTVLKEMAVEGAPEGTVVIASVQTAGKGRMNRKFISPADTGLYMSILLRPKVRTEEALFITTAAAVAVALTVEEISGKKAGIKWVNDVQINGRKICGILTEASFDMESGGLEYAICGIGVNVLTPEGGFPEEIREIAGAVFEAQPSEEARNRIAAGIIGRFMGFYYDLGDRPFYDEYVSRSVTVGNDIIVYGQGEPRKAYAVAIDRNCRLVARFDDGHEESLNSGEVSARIKPIKE